jgi:hypothetical protein
MEHLPQKHNVPSNIQLYGWVCTNEYYIIMITNYFKKKQSSTIFGIFHLHRGDETNDPGMTWKHKII